MKKPRSLLEEIAGLKDPTPKDFDPEDVSYDRKEAEDSNSEDDTRNAQATSHYEEVGESRLRRKEAASLGPQYAGAKISRGAVDDEDEDDPFERSFDEDDESSDEDPADGLDELAEGLDEDEDEELDDGRSGSDLTDEEGSFTDEEIVEEDEEDAGDMSSDLEDDGDEDLAGRPSHKSTNGQPKGIDRSELRKLMADDQRNVAQALTQSIKADAEKGIAVKQQRSNFDSLLNIRVKLQKAIIATNSISQSGSHVAGSDKAYDAVVAAEEAALKLWNNVSSLRSSLDIENGSKKRKFAEADEDTSLSTLWTEIRRSESEAASKRNASLDFWSAKCRPAALTNPSRRLNAPVQQSLSDVLAGHLSDMSRLVAKTRVPRSCVSADVAQTLVSRPTAVDEDEEMDADDSKLPIYDDADFYGVLLQQLISQRSENSQATATANLDSFASEPWQAARATKTKRLDVDTKASKGRKLRYTVHEKLQNFMAPEDRTSWNDGQCNELFGNLFGMGVGLRESNELDAEDLDGDDHDGVEAGIEGLRLFSAVGV